MAEGLFIHLLKEEGLEDEFQVESCGTSGWHVGELPDRRMRATAARHGVDLPSRSRQIRHSDFTDFDYILAMDSSNLYDLKKLAGQIPDATAQIFKMRHFDDQYPDSDVPDPYYGGDQGFEDVYKMLLRANKNLLEYIKTNHSLA